MDSRDLRRRSRDDSDGLLRDLSVLGFQDPPAAARLIFGLAEDGTDGRTDEVLDTLLEPVPASPDPDRALRNLAALLSTCGAETAARIASTPDGPRSLAVVLGSSQSIASFLLQHPEYVEEILTSDPPPDRDDVRRDLFRRIATADEAGVLRLLRLHRRLQAATIVTDDLCRDASLEVVTRRISDLAEDLIEAALIAASRETGAPRDAFAVIAMGKLGGAELNYSSDVDLVFVHADDAPDGSAFVHLSERICRLLSQTTVDDRALRVDMRLRPEGSRGPLVQSLSATVSYYVEKGRTWERQALIKARPVAGNPALGHALVEALQPFVYESALDATGIREVRELKQRIEERVRTRGGSGGDVKEGHGGIRDIEFTVQFLQLLNGREAPQVRSHGTLDGLERLQAAGVLRSGERRRLEETYRFLRVVEHRLQTMYETPARRLPTDRGKLRRLALRIRPGAPRPDDPAGEFLERYRHLTESANAILERLVHAPFENPAARETEVVDTVLDSSDEEAARQVVAGFGFRDPAAAVRSLRSLASEKHSYLPRRRQFFASLAPALLRRVEGAVDPDGTLLRFEQLVTALGASSLLYQLLGENEDVLAILVDLCGGSPFLTGLVTANPEMFDPMMESLIVARRGGLLPFEDLPTAESLIACPDLPRALHSLRDLETVRVGIRDLQGRANVRNVMEDLSRLADEIVRLTLAALSARVFEAKGEPRAADGTPGRFAIIALGRLGAGEMIYGSDLDLVFVHDAAGKTTRDHASADVLTELAQQIIRTIGGHSSHGRLYQVDARLRPGGSSGPLLPSLAAFARHVTESAETWERLALLRARAIAGDPSLGRDVIDIIHRVLYQAPPAPGLAADVVAMRERIEETAEGFDLKRGPGGLLDIEFLTGWMQLRHGHALPAARVPSLMGALSAVAAAGYLDPVRHEKLLSAYQMVRKVESRLRIAYNTPLDRVPDEDEQRDVLARRLGYRGGALPPGKALTDEILYFTRLTRDLFEGFLLGNDDE
jgi:[glutamine synthetase] adenylyltransferase / [glutamine synthetase]-adenylyl-L-tyrosine phosphorylase